MKLTVDKDTIQEKLSYATHFTLSQLSAIPSLQGGMIRFSKDKITIITTNLKDYFVTESKINTKTKKDVVVDIKKVVEFLNLLPSGEIELVIEEKELTVKKGKTKGSFNIIPKGDFPEIPSIKGKMFKLKKNLLQKELPLVLFAAAHDEARPFLTGVKFQASGDKMHIVATDGFRLSIISRKKTEDIPDTLISADVLGEVVRLDGGLGDADITFSDKDKLVLFDLGEHRIYSRIIEGDFPPFEKVIPSDYTSKATLKRDEFLRNIKLCSVFARDFSNIVVFELREDGVYLRPRVKRQGGAVVHQDARVEGDAAKIAFNYKFVLDFLSNTDAKEVVFEMTKKNAPGVFRIDTNEDFLHIIMPVRTDEDE